MGHINPGRPAEDEYPVFLGGHVRRVPDGDIIDLLDQQTATIERVLAAYTAAQAAWRPAPGEWNAIEITGHLADIERVHAFRAFTFARGDAASLPGMNPVAYMEASGFGDRSLADVTAEFVAVRAATMALLRHLDATAWMRSGRMNGTPITVRAFVYIIAGHHALHLADLERYPALADQAHASAPVR
jgi:hypothetical protein